MEPNEPVLREADGNGNLLSVALRKANVIKLIASVLQGGVPDSPEAENLGVRSQKRACRRDSYRSGQTPCD